MLKKSIFRQYFSMFYAITPLFFIKIQKIIDQNVQKFLLFPLLIGQKVLAPFVWKLEPSKDTQVLCFLTFHKGNLILPLSNDA